MNGTKMIIKKIISMILVIGFILELIPGSVYARDNGGGDGDTHSGYYSKDGFDFIYEESDSWNNYANASITIRNNTEYDKSLWKVVLIYNGIIDNIWNADIEECTKVSDGTYIYLISPQNYNSTIISQSDISFGFISYGTEDVPVKPEDIYFWDGTPLNEIGSYENNDDDLSSVTNASKTDAEPKVIEGREYPIKEEWKGLYYTLFTSSENGEALNVNTADIGGSVHTNGNFSFQGNAISISGVLEAAGGITLKTADIKDSQNISSDYEKAEKIEMPDIDVVLHQMAINDREEENNWKIYPSYQQFGTDTIELDKNIYVEDGISFNGTTFNSTGIILANKDISFNVNETKVGTDNTVFIASEEGNITLNGSNINLNAVLYAPNGNVTVNANEFHLSGRIIAKEININGTIVDINAGIHDFDMLDDIGVFYHEVIKTFDTKEDFSNGNNKSNLNLKPEFNNVSVSDKNIYSSQNDINDAGLMLDKKDNEKVYVNKNYSVENINIGESFSGIYDKNDKFSGNLKLSLNKKAENIDKIYSYNGHYYAISKDLTLKENAKEICEDMGGYLCIMDNEEELDFINEVIKEQYGKEISCFFDDQDTKESSIILPENYVCEWNSENDITINDLKTISIRFTVPKDTVVDLSKLPSSVTENKIMKDENENSIILLKINAPSSEIDIPISIISSEESLDLISNLSVYYGNKEHISSEKLEDVKILNNRFYYTGSWSTVCDSLQNDAVWSYFDMKALYPNDGSIRLYAYASNDPEELLKKRNNSELKIITEEEVSDKDFEGLKGRYLYIKAEIMASADNRTPFIDKIIVGANTEKRSKNTGKEYLQQEICGKASLNKSEEGSYSYKVITTKENDNKVIWECEGEKKTGKDINGYKNYYSFDTEGSHLIKAYYENEISEYATKNISVKKEISDIKPEDINAEVNTYPFFNCSLDKDSYVTGENVSVITDIKSEYKVSVLYDGLKYETSIEEGRFDISNVTKGTHQVVIETRNKDNYSFVRRVSFDVTDPEIEEPSTEESSTEEISTEESSTEEISSEEPSTEESSTEEPSTEESSTEEPSTEEISTEEPSTEEDIPDYDIFKTYDSKKDFEICSPIKGRDDIKTEFDSLSADSSDIYGLKDLESREGLILDRKEVEDIRVDKSFNYWNFKAREEFSGSYKDDGTFSGNLTISLKSDSHEIDSIYMYNGHAYAVSDHRLLWPEAKNRCEDIGGHLVIINDAEENEFVRKITKEKTNSDYTCIGLSDKGHEGIWEGVDGSKVEYTNWNSGEPNNGGGWGYNKQDYAFMYENGTWDDGYDTSKGYYVCEWEDIKNVGIYDFKTVVMKMVLPKDAMVEEVKGDTFIEDCVKYTDDADNQVFVYTVNVGKDGIINIPVSITTDGENLDLIKDLAFYFSYKGQVKTGKLKDITIKNDRYCYNGRWSTVYDSGKDDAEWSYFDLKALYPCDGKVKLYAYASNDLEDVLKDRETTALKEIREEEAVSTEGVTGISGRYIYMRLLVSASYNDKTPFVDSITIGANTTKRPEKREKHFLINEISGKEVIYTGEQAEYSYNTLADKENEWPTGCWEIEGKYAELDDPYRKDEDFKGIDIIRAFDVPGKHKLKVYYPEEEKNYATKEIKVIKNMEYINEKDIISAVSDYPYFNASIDKASYLNGDDVFVTTDIKDEYDTTIYYDDEILDTPLVDKGFKITNVKTGKHTIKIVVKKKVGNTFQRVINFGVYDAASKVKISLDKENYDPGDDVKLTIEEGYNITSCTVDGKQKEEIEDSGRDVIIKNLSEGTHTLDVNYQASSEDEIQTEKIYVHINLKPIDINNDRIVPTVDIISPKEGDKGKGKIDIIGTVKDDVELESYELSYKKYGAETEDYTLISSGKNEIINSLVGTLDSNLLEEGNYVLKLEARDKAGNSSYKMVGIIIEKSSKENLNDGEYDEIQYNLLAEIKSAVIDNDKSDIEIYGVVKADGFLKKYRLSYQKEKEEKSKLSINNEDENDNENTEVILVEGTMETEAQYEEKGELLGRIYLNNITPGKYKIILYVEDVNNNNTSAVASFQYTKTEEIKVETSTSVTQQTFETAVEKNNNESGENVENQTSTDAPVNHEEVQPEIKTDYSGFKLTLTYLRTAIGRDVKAVVNLGSGMDINKVKVYKDGELLSEKEAITHFTSEKAGKVKIKAVYTIDETEDKNIASDTDAKVKEDGSTNNNEIVLVEECVFFNDKDTVCPVGNLIKPELYDVITGPVDIIGTAYDETKLDFWRLEYRMVPYNEYRLIAEGHENIDKGILGKLDPSMMINGEYELRLTIQDEGGNYRTIQSFIIIESKIKVGYFNIGFNDVSAPIAGTTVNINRRYDSRNKNIGDFGYGWSMDLDGFKIVVTNGIDKGYYTVTEGFKYVSLSSVNESIDHSVYVYYGDGTSDRFKLNVDGKIESVFSDRTVTGYVDLNYTCMTSNDVKLELIGNKAFYYDGELLLDSYLSHEFGYNYKLTTKDKNEIYFNTILGVTKFVDKDGHTIKVNQNSYKSDDGEVIKIDRNIDGLVTKITDTYGDETVYTYDDNKNLIAVTDAAGKTVRYTYDNDHNLISMKGPDGCEVSRNEYDDDGRMIATIDSEGNRIEFDHDISNRQEVIKDRNGNVTINSYDEEGNIIKVTDPYGNVSTTEYDKNHNITKRTDAAGNETQFTYNKDGNLTRKVTGAGDIIYLGYMGGKVDGVAAGDTGNINIYYDVNENPSELLLDDGKATFFQYDERRNNTSISDGIGTIVTYKYDDNNNVIESTDGEGHVTKYTRNKYGKVTQTSTIRTVNGVEKTIDSFMSYDKAGNIIQKVDSEGNTTHYTYDVNNNMTSTVDKLGNETKYDYDKRGNITKITYSDGTFESFEYDANGNNISATDTRGVKILMTYDKLDRMTSKEYVGGGKESYTYDAVGNIVSKDVNGNVTRYEYDGSGRNTAVIDPYGNKFTYEYDARNRLIKKSIASKFGDQEFNSTIEQYTYDQQNNKISVSRQFNVEERSVYDERGQLVERINEEGNSTKYSYDKAGHMTSVTDALGNVTSYEYDEAGNVTRVTDPKGNSYSYTYDSLSRLTSKTNSLGKSCTYEYDVAGNITRSTDYSGDVTVNEYDSLGRIIKTDVSGEVTTYDYKDEAGNEVPYVARITNKEGTISYKYDDLGRLISKTDTNNIELKYEYTLNGKLSKLITPYGTTAYEYDKLDRIVRVVDHNGNITLYTYDALGNRSTMTYSNGMKAQYYYDEASRLSGIDIVDKKSNVIKKYVYTRDKVGHPTTIEETSPNGAVKTTHYSYDASGRLVSESIEDSKGSINYSYTYDEVGNRTSLVVETSGSIKGLCDNAMSIRTGETKYSYNDNNQLISEEYNGLKTLYSYDDNGNLIQVESGNNIQKYEYNAENKMSSYKNSAGREFKYIYDAEGNRIGKSVDGCLTKYVISEYNSLGYVLLELDSDDKVIKHYTIADELIGFEYDSADYCYVNNGHGDVAFVTDGTGAIVNTYSYTAYGTALICDEKVSNSFRYTGEYYDAESGLYYLRARYMNPETGTFTQEDTYQGNIYDALSLHKYLYAQDNPVIYKDPTGNTISLVEHLIAAGQWVVDFAKTLWKLKTYSTFAKAAFVAQIVSLTAQIRSLIVSETLSEGIENFLGITLTLVGLLEINVKTWVAFLNDGVSIFVDLVHLYEHLLDIDKYKKELKWDFISLGCDIVGLVCDIAGVKYDKQKRLQELKRQPSNRTSLQRILIDWTDFMKKNGLLNDEEIGNLLNLAKKFGNWDDIWILIFHSYKEVK